MKVANMLGERFKNAPKDCVIESHALMMRGGYMKYMANGIFSLYTPAKRIMRKIEQIIREEMDAVDGQEVMFPVVMPASLWEESGRYTGIGSEMARWKDRSGNPMVLGMTHEEAAVHLARDTASSYADYPFMIYQIQTKFRDEPRARGGLIRVREFTMKDAYSFHTSQADLERYYSRVYEAYNRIFERCGCKQFISVQSDSGMMGGSISHEFMLLTEVGEDTLAICDCGYRANMEAAVVNVQNEPGEIAPLTKISTPNIKTIEDLKNFLHTDEKKLAKAVVYQKNEDDSYVIVFIRGDLEVNETKLRNYLGFEIHPAVEITEESGIVAGFIGPVGLSDKIRVVYDKSLDGIENLVCGANEADAHFTGLNLKRDLGNVEMHDFAKTFAGAICPECGKPNIHIEKGIEIGNIFQLGKKYTEAMNMTYLDENGDRKIPIMGCYGIGVGRLCASVCQESHDDYGPIWPMTIAPWQVEICNLRVDDPAVKETADRLYAELTSLGVEVLYDDRDIRPGAMFADADLFGIPLRAVVSPKALAAGGIEISARDKSFKETVPADQAAIWLRDQVIKMLRELNEQGD
ncbi:MAG: proline--tRNA ligase [Oscillospiraceae bacterium]|nr:proline--tRNA ligase [Oscillospiraceae bacterium]